MKKSIVSKVTELECCKYIEDENLEVFANLEKLTIVFNRTVSGSCLKKFTKLKYLKIARNEYSNNNIFDYENIKYVANTLEHLDIDISEENIVDRESFSWMKKLCNLTHFN